MKKKSKLNKKIFLPVNRPIVTEGDARKIYKVVKSGWISSAGPDITLFEKNLSKFVNRKYACAVSSGTAALEIAVKSLGLNKNDEIIMPTFTIISNAIAIIKNLAKPVLIDSDLETWNIAVKKIEERITKKTKAIMLPHIYGFPCDMNKILKICKKYKLYLIEDAAEMLGQNYKKNKCGSFGDISTFSFYANKHITTGEGGMVLTNNKNLYEKIKDLKNLNFGKTNRFNHTDISWNYRLTNIQAALGVNQLKRINQIIKKKRFIGNYYYKSFINNKNILIQPKETSYAKNIYWIYGIVLKINSLKYKTEIQEKLLKKGIETRPFFWPMHKQDIFKKLNLFKNEKYPNAEYLSNNGFYIPTSIDLTKKQLSYIADTVNSIIR
jgi:perosamine synthetase